MLLPVFSESTRISALMNMLFSHGSEHHMIGVICQQYFHSPASIKTKPGSKNQSKLTQITYYNLYV